MQISEVEIKIVGTKMQISGVDVLLWVPRYRGMEWPRWRSGVFCAQFSLEEGQERVALASHRKLLRI